ncbi:hypothetical protein ANCCEY_07264 [Ancylostoma ceylanicum]|uniref:Tyr recombinase domain-containing protein n=2 Tax=Ancylostoma ceylanicum TaxID=53326 RepID=A0A0D6LUB3_9BILA|nr:hypothetical protein ANCCEY_07264 [Ancylostoma ceylanicum]EYB89057.1 hypothetical protein Y032_0237g3255 [Ancylostoma ceylanicum]
MGRHITRLMRHIFARPVVHSAASDFIFSAKDGKAPSGDYLARQIKKVLADAGLAHRRLTPHSFRDGAATQALRKGIDSGKVMLAGRWKSFKSFQAYIDPSPV